MSKKTTKNPVFPPMPTLAPAYGLSTLLWRQIHFAYQWVAANFRVLINSVRLSFVSSHFLRLKGSGDRGVSSARTRRTLMLRCSRSTARCLGTLGQMRRRSESSTCVRCGTTCRTDIATPLAGWHRRNFPVKSPLSKGGGAATAAGIGRMAWGPKFAQQIFGASFGACDE